MRGRRGYSSSKSASELKQPGRNMAQTAPDDFGDTVDLREDGILWMINRTIFHPRGFALAITPDETDLILVGDGEKPWAFDPAMNDTEDELFAQFEAMLQRRRDMAAQVKSVQEDDNV